MGSAREWPKLSEHPLDFQYLPSAMGHAPMLGLGMAMAQPRREVIVLNGDGCMLMSLGCLATIAASGVRNFTLIVLENGLYEVTGGQQTAGSAARVDFAGLAKGAGIASLSSFDDLATWRAGARAALDLPGPRFIVLSVEPVDEYALPTPTPIVDRIAAFVAALK
jgi:thiamine pyrophosphate-dependent acetolactate synthase large subunit-like protein